MTRQKICNLLLLLIFAGAPLLPFVGAVCSARRIRATTGHATTDHQERSVQHAPSAEAGLTLEELQQLALANNPTLARPKPECALLRGGLSRRDCGPIPRWATAATKFAEARTAAASKEYSFSRT